MSDLSYGSLLYVDWAVVGSCIICANTGQGRNVVYDRLGSKAHPKIISGTHLYRVGFT